MIVLFVYQLPSFSGQSACFFTLVFQTITVKHPARSHHSTRPSSDARSPSGTLLWWLSKIGFSVPHTDETGAVSQPPPLLHYQTTQLTATVLWSSNHASAWQIGILVVVFFGIIWAFSILLFGHLSKSHSWVLPVFACGLGAPRWAQIWWGVSGAGLYLPWAGSYITGALVSRSLWLWLGVLDTLQGVGFGIILLQTLTRLHICFTLSASQVLGSIATICARGFAPNKIGPGPISPDITAGGSALANAWFWVALFFQLSIWYVSFHPLGFGFC